MPTQNNIRHVGSKIFFCYFADKNVILNKFLCYGSDIETGNFPPIFLLRSFARSWVFFKEVKRGYGRERERISIVTCARCADYLQFSRSDSYCSWYPYNFLRVNIISCYSKRNKGYLSVIPPQCRYTPSKFDIPPHCR